MKRFNYLFFCIAIVTTCICYTSCQSNGKAKGEIKLTNALDSASYALGVINGNGIKDLLDKLPGEPIKTEVLMAAIEEAIKKNPDQFQMDIESANTFLTQYFQEQQNKEGEKNLEIGKKFLEENKTKQGIITTESGLQYKVVTEGNGERPKITDKVKVHYSGELLDGTVFQSSIEQGEPVSFAVAQIIEGWKEGLQIMPVGSKYIFWIPSDLAYGASGTRDGKIKPNSTLKFEVELFEIIKE